MAPPTDIQLRNEADELYGEARTRLTALKERVARQRSGELEEGETKLSPQEIAEEKQAVEEIVAEAKALEGVDNLDTILGRDSDQLAPFVRGLKEVMAGDGGLRAPNAEEPEEAMPFDSMGRFLKSLRTMTGDYDDPVDLSDEERQYLKQLRAGATLYSKGQRVNQKDLGNMEVKALTGESGGGGEALVPTQHMTELLRTMGEQQQFAQRARRIPMARRTIDFPRLKQTDSADTRPLYGFAAVAKIAEGAEKPEREPEFEQFTLSAIKYAAYLEAGDELLEESIIDAQPVLTGLLTDAIAYEFDRDTMRGSGTGEPQGFIGSDAEWVQGRATANQINLADIFGMEERFFGTDGVYLHHPSAIPQIYALAESNIIVWHPDLAEDVPGTLLGRPLVRSHKLPILGTKGDLNLVDPSFYLVGDLQTISVSNSIHYRFRNDLTAWRAVFRAAGSPWPAGLFSHEASGGNLTFRVSPFVVLGDVVTS